MTVEKFKYILCYCSSRKRGNKHEERRTFKYILCYCSSRENLSLFFCIKLTFLVNKPLSAVFYQPLFFFCAHIQYGKKITARPRKNPAVGIKLSYAIN